MVPIYARRLHYRGQTAGNDAHDAAVHVPIALLAVGVFSMSWGEMFFGLFLGMVAIGALLLIGAGLLAGAILF